MSVSVRVLIAFGAALATVAGCQPAARTGQAPGTNQATLAELGVEQLAKSPEAYLGQSLRLRGVVASTAGERKLFTVIDEAEYKSCREFGCAAFEVPIAFAGALPETARIVRVAGRLEQPELGRYVVRADSVETIQ